MKKSIFAFLLSIMMTTTVQAACLSNANGSITCSSDATGNIDETLNGDIVVSNGTAPKFGIILSDTTGDINLINNGDITNLYGGGISYNPTAGTNTNLTIVQNGDIIRGRSSGGYGIYAANFIGNADITLNGKINADTQTVYVYGIVARGSDTNTIRLGKNSEIILQSTSDKDLRALLIAGDVGNIYLGQNSVVNTIYGGGICHIFNF